MDTDVLVVGAGPTGLMLANQLGRRGVRVMIIDRHAGPSRETRALGVQARTLEIYAKLGLAERAIGLGTRGTGANLWARGRKMARVPLGEAGKGITPYPFVLVLGQDDNERIMGEKLKDWGLGVQWNTELVGLEQQPDHAVVTLKSADGATRTITASWVAGCDGARSAVREINGIKFPGAPYEHVYFVADVQVTGNMVPGEVNVYLWRDGFHLFFPMRGQDHWRVVGILPAELRDREHPDFDAVIPSIRGEAGAALDFKACSWFSTYRIHHRSASRFRDRRCFLAGDAAHIHSPVGAQGMNTGLQDAYNLAWKLALVIEGKARESLLDTYEGERLPNAQQLLNTTDRAFRFVVSNNWLAGLLRTEVIARIAAFAVRHPAIQKVGFRTISQTGIHYRDALLSQNLQAPPPKAPQAGDRFPWMKLKLRAGGPVEDMFQALDDTQFNLLVFRQRLPREGLPNIGDLLRTHVVPEDPANDAERGRVHIPRESFYLIRPDGHIGLCGGRFDAAAMSRYVTQRLAMTA